MTGANKEVSEEMRRLAKLGWKHEGQGGGSHNHLTHPEYGRIVMPLSPSDRRWLQAHRTQVAKLMGITRAELEERMGVRSRKRPAGRARKSKRDEAARAAHELKLRQATMRDDDEPEPKSDRFVTLEDLGLSERNLP